MSNPRVLVISVEDRYIYKLIEHGIEIVALTKEDRASLDRQLSISHAIAGLTEEKMSYAPQKTNKPAYRNTLPRRQARY